MLPQWSHGFQSHTNCGMVPQFLRAKWVQITASCNLFFPLGCKTQIVVFDLYCVACHKLFSDDCKFKVEVNLFVAIYIHPPIFQNMCQAFFFTKPIPDVGHHFKVWTFVPSVAGSTLASEVQKFPGSTIWSCKGVRWSSWKLNGCNPRLGDSAHGTCFSACKNHRRIMLIMFNERSKWKNCVLGPR